MENNTFSNTALQIHLVEYKALRSEIEIRLNLQQNLVMRLGKLATALERLA